MKKILYILLIPLMLWACVDGVSEAIPEGAIEEGGHTELQFKVYMPEQEVVSTRSAEGVKDLYLLVFDENNRFLSKNKAIVEGVLDKDNAQQFKVVLLSSEAPRTIHFIANYPSWDEFPPSHELRGKDEGDIISRMEADVTTYWHKHEFAEIKDHSSFNQIYPLLRNRAKIELSNKIEDELQVTEMILYNAPKSGTIAPFSYNPKNQEYKFEKGILTPSLSMENLDPIKVEYQNENSFELFEKENVGVEEHSFIILKANYKKDFKKAEECFYKIVLVEDKEKGTLYNIMRNTLYKVTLEGVSSKGYSSLAEAVAAPPSNNIFASTELQEYPTISDGFAILKVDKIGETFVRKGDSRNPETFETLITYYPNKSKEENQPGKIEVVRNETESEDYFDFKYDTKTGKLVVTVKQIPKESVKIFKLIVKTKETEKSNLLRYITLVFRNPYKFNATVKSDGNLQGDQVIVSFDIPNTMINSVFPFKVKISSKDISPDPSQSDLSIDFDKSDYFFIYNVRGAYKGSRVTLNFKRAVNHNSIGSRVIFLESKYFEKQEVNLPR